MDDAQKLKAEFPLGDLKIVVTEPSEGQLFALALSRTSKDADTSRLVRRVLRVLEALVGPETWYDVIEEAMITEAVTPEQLMRLANAVFEFPWKDHRNQPGPEPEQGHEPEPPAAAPRIVSGG